METVGSSKMLVNTSNITRHKNPDEEEEEEEEDDDDDDDDDDDTAPQECIIYNLPWVSLKVK
jgi:hypothetical protein